MKNQAAFVHGTLAIRIGKDFWHSVVYFLSSHCVVRLAIKILIHFLLDFYDMCDHFQGIQRQRGHLDIPQQCQHLLQAAMILELDFGIRNWHKFCAKFDWLILELIKW